MNLTIGETYEVVDQNQETLRGVLLGPMQLFSADRLRGRTQNEPLEFPAYVFKRPEGASRYFGYPYFAAVPRARVKLPPDAPAGFTPAHRSGEVVEFEVYLSLEWSGFSPDDLLHIQDGQPYYRTFFARLMPEKLDELAIPGAIVRGRG